MCLCVHACVPAWVFCIWGNEVIVAGTLDHLIISIHALGYACILVYVFVCAFLRVYCMCGKWVFVASNARPFDHVTCVCVFMRACVSARVRARAFFPLSACTCLCWAFLFLLLVNDVDTFPTCYFQIRNTWSRSWSHIDTLYPRTCCSRSSWTGTRIERVTYNKSPLKGVKRVGRKRGIAGVPNMSNWLLNFRAAYVFVCVRLFASVGLLWICVDLCVRARLLLLHDICVMKYCIYFDNHGEKK